MPFSTIFISHGKAPPIHQRFFAEQDFFSDGISEELLNLLAKISELRPTSSFGRLGRGRKGFP